MKISLIVAMANNQVIGLNNTMPWHLSADLKKFKAITMGAPIIMGRKTYQSIGRPLPGRTNIIISRNVDYHQEGCLVFNSLETALKKAAQIRDEAFFIGGSELYKSALPMATTLYLTQIHHTFEGDTFFPELNWPEWRIDAQEDIETDAQVDFNYSFLTLERII